MTYGTHASFYLHRATTRLAEGSEEGLFYAAFELRCGVEARMQEYLEVQRSLTKKQKKGYQVAELGRKIDSLHKIGDKYARFTLEDGEGNVIGVFHYTPVTTPLRKLAQWSGDLLHAQRKDRPQDDPWWASTRRSLEEMRDLLRLATSGDLLGVPLKDQFGRVEVPLAYPPEMKLRERVQSGGRHRFRVEYLTSPPPELLDA